MIILMGGQMAMPIHDHQGMVVFSKCVKGSFDVDYWDFKDSDSVYQKVDKNQIRHKRMYEICKL